jgi:hypothetical protein
MEQRRREELQRDAAKGLSLRHDHGSNTMSGDFQDEIAFLGIGSSPSFSANRRAMASPPSEQCSDHPHPEGELPVGAHLRHHGIAAPRAAGVRCPI